MDQVRQLFTDAYGDREWDWTVEPTPLRDQQFLINPVEHTRQFESDPMIDITRSNEHERHKGEDPRSREERSR